MTTEWWNELKSITLHVEGEKPPLWNPTASEENRAARLALVEAEVALRDQVEAVAAQRRALPPGPVLPAYEFTEGPVDLSADGPSTPVTLAELFGDHDELVVYHIMFHPDDDAACAMCSLWVDGLHGVSHHITRRAGLAVVGKAPIDKLRAWACRRGWRGLRLVSAYGTSFTTDLGVEGSRGAQVPAVSVFTRDGDEVRHAYIQNADLPDGQGRGIDLISPVWQVLDLLPSGRGDWLPDNTYPGALRGEAVDPIAERGR
ncbi:MAG: DUF899 domain-containing protein [Streptosporangiales bacterium]|nr:DUF899 domain-containing protein [Streptosporangiales bacterium]